MADEQLWEVWRRAGDHLDQARLSLTNPDDEALGIFDEFREHNELGLALDQLTDVADVADVADEQRAPRAVWEELGHAATAMGLGEDAPMYGAAVRLIREYLARAGDWAELHSLLSRRGSRQVASSISITQFELFV